VLSQRWRNRLSIGTDDRRATIAPSPPQAAQPGELSAITALARQGQYERAAALAETLTARYPRDPRPWAELARYRLMTGRQAQGVEAIQRLEKLAPDDPVTFNFIGGLYSLADLPLRAAPHFRRAAQARPDHPRFVYDLAASQRMTGALDDALRTVERAIALDPANTEALWVRSDLRQATAERNNIDDLEARLRAPLDPRQEVFVRYTLARECEEVGDWARAFGHLQRGAALQSSFQRYEVDRDVKTLDAFRRRHTADAVAQASPGSEDDRPIFIVGLPRTGTTLVERILGAHPKVRLIGESSAFDRVLLDLALEHRLTGAESVLAESGLSLPMHRLGEGYLAQATAPPRLRFIDKQPRNGLNVGFIRAALPNARIVLLDRGPMDACWAMHKALFQNGSYPFSVDLADLADYYAAWRRLADHWLEAFGDAIVHIRYEDLVQDFAGQARRLVAGCGLDWNPSCLAFHKSTRPSSTASAVQIRRPLYASSIGLWRRYETQLAPLADRLRALGVDVD